MRIHSGIAPIIAGLVLVALGQLAQRLMPLIGRAAFQAAAAGSYRAETYELSLTGYYIVAFVLVALGLALFVVERRQDAEGQ